MKLCEEEINSIEDILFFLEEQMSEYEERLFDSQIDMSFTWQEKYARQRTIYRLLLKLQEYILKENDNESNS